MHFTQEDLRPSEKGKEREEKDDLTQRGFWREGRNDLLDGGTWGEGRVWCHRSGPGRNWGEVLLTVLRSTVRAGRSLETEGR